MVFELLQQRIVVEFVVEQVGQRAVAPLDLRIDPVPYRLGRVPAAEDTHAHVRAGILGEEVAHQYGKLRVLGDLAANLVIGVISQSCG